MKRNIFLFIIILCVCVCSYGQGEIDAYRLSRNELGGTARGMAMGGSLGALGGDITAITANPAGIGIYHSSEVLGTLNFSSTAIETNWKGSVFKDNKSKFNFNNLSYVGYYPLGNESMSSINFGFSYNRLKNFDRQYTAGGRNMESSLTDYIARLTNGVEDKKMDHKYGDPYNNNVSWLSILGWNGYLIDSEFGLSNNTSYLSPLGEGALVDPKLSVSEKGHIESYDFSLGTNVDEKLYLGLTFSFTDISYVMQSFYTEEVPSMGGGFDLKNNLETKGSGSQISIGAIYRPINELRFGVAYHSPTWYSLTDYYQGFTEENFNPSGIGDRGLKSTPDNTYYDYKFRTPSRWTFSAAAILGTKALVNVDYELADYTGMELQDANGYNNVEDNSFIDQDFKKSSTIRAGIEYRVTPLFALRAGYALMQHPYQKDVRDGNVRVMTAGTIPHYTLEGDVRHLTCGLGFVFPSSNRTAYYIDLAFVHSSQTDDLYYFSKFIENNTVWLDSTPAELKNNTYRGVLTFGYKF